MSTGIDTEIKRSGGGALELGDLRLLEDGSERESALGSDSVALETVRDRAGW